jgi:hypothetical protein
MLDNCQVGILLSESTDKWIPTFFNTIRKYKFRVSISATRQPPSLRLGASQVFFNISESISFGVPSSLGGTLLLVYISESISFGVPSSLGGTLLLADLVSLVYES